MKFINVKTGAILEPNSEMVIDQMKRSDLYKEYKEKTKEKTKDEIKSELDAKGIEYDSKATKEILLSLLEE